MSRYLARVRDLSVARTPKGSLLVLSEPVTRSAAM